MPAPSISVPGHDPNRRGGQSCGIHRAADGSRSVSPPLTWENVSPCGALTGLRRAAREVHRHGRRSHIVGRRCAADHTTERRERPDRGIVAGRGQGRARRAGPAAGSRRADVRRSWPGSPRAAWQPVESERLGEWELRARRAGFTRRANSVLPLGDPGLPLDEALARVRRWYEARGLPAYVQTATGRRGHPGAARARSWSARGWRARSRASCGSRRSRRSPTWTPDVPAVRLSRAPDEAWLRALPARRASPDVRAAGAERRAVGVVRDRARRGADGPRPRSGGVWSTDAGPASWPSRSTRRTGGRAWRPR